MTRGFALFLAISAAVVGTTGLAQHSKELLPRYTTKSARNPPHVVARPAGAQLKAPDGFSVQAWASGFAMPRFMLEGSQGEVLIADSGPSAEAAAVGSAGSHAKDGAVYVVPHERPSEKKKLISALNRPYGLALWKNYLYVAESESVKRYPYDPEKLQAGAGEEVVGLAGLGGGHWTRSLLFDRGGTKLYVGIGSASNVSAGEDPRRAAINRYNPDGSGHETFASGTRNPIGVHWYPDSDMLWAAVQERDELGDDLPSDYLTHVQEHGFYGWPFAYLGPHEDPRLKGEHPDLVQKAITPDVLLGAHVAVLDFTLWESATDRLEVTRARELHDVDWRTAMKSLTLELPKFGFIVATRAMIGVGIGLLLAERIPEDRRRAIGLTLLGIGAASTIPAIMVLRRAINEHSALAA